jgi:RNA polymerase sigma-70 factor, ECF subfamily
MEFEGAIVSIIEGAKVTRSLPTERAITRHLDELYRFALHMTRDADRAQELTQESMFRALKNQGRIIRNPKAWLFQTLYNTFISEYRRRLSRHRFSNQVDVLAAESEVLRDPLPGLVAVRDVRTAVESLPEDLRAVIWLSDAEDFRLKEIAEILGVPLGTVASRLFRARQELRQLLSVYGPVEEKNL